jgi:hypothetical protein
MVVCAGLLLTNNVSAQQSAEQVKSAIIGSWDLNGDTRPSKDGVVIKGMAFGEKSMGRFIFLSNGQYFTLAIRSDTPKFVADNRYDGTAEENKAVVRGSIGHYGTYSIREDGKEIILKAIASTWPAWVDAEQKRPITINGDQMVSKAKSTMGVTSELTFKRVN